jgi:hypothetical protein
VLTAKAEAVASTRTCTACNNTFIGRSNARFCSPACRQSAHRSRKGQNRNEPRVTVVAPGGRRGHSAEAVAVGVNHRVLGRTLHRVGGAHQRAQRRRCGAYVAPDLFRLSIYHYLAAKTVVRGTGIEPATSSVSGKRSPAELTAPGRRIGGGDGNRTRVHGFAGRCLTTRPLHRGV